MTRERRPEAPRNTTRIPADQGAFLETTPGAAGYDAYRTALVQDMTSREVFDSEPVDREWAPRMTDALRTVIAEGLEREGVGFEISSIECRTASCRVELAMPEAQAAMARTVLSTTAAPGRMSSKQMRGPDADGRSTIVSHGVFDPEIRDPAAYRRFIIDNQPRFQEILELQRKQEKL